MTAHLTQKQIEQIELEARSGALLRFLASQFTHQAIADRHGLHRNTVYRYASGIAEEGPDWSIDVSHETSPCD